ncbi:hypothetical protein FRB99_003583 [Tulasnella sp. 403]|nr:hypothetical protein FRB99_003583 [Tulasnella sp. 403]
MSTLFDFTADPRQFIRTMLALIFAATQELGYTNAIKHHALLGRTVQSLHYRMSNSGLGGEEEEPSVIVRDVWLDELKRTERQIQQEIFSALQDLCKDRDPPGDPSHNDVKLQGKDEAQWEELKFKGEEKAKCEELVGCIKDGMFRKYFLTILADKEGELTRGAPEGATSASDVFDPPPYTPQEASVPGSDASRTLATSHYYSHSASLPNTSVKCTWCPKRPYRLVYKEVCTPLNDVNDFAEAVKTLTHGVTGGYPVTWFSNFH